MITHNVDLGDRVHVWFMEESGAAFGGIYQYHEAESCPVLYSMSVEKGKRRKGLGTAMQVAREEYAKTVMGATRVALWVSHETPAWVRNWYERRGYKFIRDDDTYVWLEKELT
jgi:GNAT superfamily N-acetyltransferase